MHKKILIVGAGGIGSWLAANLYESERHGQLEDVSIFFADHDTVEPDNLTCLLYTSPSPRDVEESRMPSSA